MKIASLLLVLVVLAAGCTGSAPKASTSTPHTTAPPATVTADTGGIEGAVSDEEHRAIPAAQVGLVRTNHTMVTDAAGKFSVSQLEPGSYDIYVSAIGFAPAGRHTSVEAGRVTFVNFTLAAVPINVSYAEGPYVYNGYSQLGEAFTDIVTAGQPVGCQKCAMYFNTTDDVVEVVLQLQFKPTLAKPGSPNMMEFQLWSTDASGSNLGVNYATTSWKSGDVLRFNRVSTMAGGDAPMPSKGDRYVLESYCETAWVCVDQKFDIYYTLFHGEPAPENYTALPASQ